jgi:hypothetical protein
MKKLVLLLSLIMVFAYSKTNAQMKMTSNGNFDVETTPAPQIWTKFGVNLSTSSATTGGWNYSITATNISIGGNKSVGSYGSSYNSTPTDGRAYGVEGVAGNSSSGFNFGVYGSLQGSNNGAGIYGVGRGRGDYNNVGGNWAGFFYGDVRITDTLTAYRVKYYSLVNMSDRRLKKNITPLTNTIFDKISQLNAVKYQYKSKKELIADGTTKPDISDSSTTAEIDNSVDNSIYYGYIAQDVQKIFPELVIQDKDGFLGINYMSLIPLMIEAIKQQDSTITSLQQQINSCCTKDTKRNERSTDQSGNNDNNADKNIAAAVLYQNTPNPFSKETQIKCFIPDGAMLSNIFIYDMQGTQKRKVQINGNGNQSITIQGSELKAGMYMYTLIIDGKEIATKKMILTD